MTPAKRDAQEFMKRVAELVKKARVHYGAAADVCGHAGWAGGDLKTGGRMLFILPNWVEVWTYVTAGAAGGVRTPNWLPAGLDAGGNTSVTAALVAGASLPFLHRRKLEPRLLVTVAGVSLGGQVLTFLEGECLNVSFLVDPAKPARPLVLMTAGGGVQIPFLPDLGRLLVDVSPRLRVKGEVDLVAVAEIDLS